MPVYKCDICNISTNLYGNYKRHLNTKKHCRNAESVVIPMVMNQNEPQMNQNEPQMNQNEPAMNQPSKKYKCDYCDSYFNTLPSKRRHELHRCTENYELESYKALYKNAQKEKREYKKQIKLLLNKVGNVTNTTITTNSNNTNNIQLNSYGKEDLSHITESMKSQMLKIPYGMIPKMIEAVHFNDNKPENKNIVLSSTKGNKIKIFSDNKWIYKSKDDTINDLVDGKYFILDSHYDKILDNICKINIDPKKYKEFREKYDEKDKELLEKIKLDSELVLLNNR